MSRIEIEFPDCGKMLTDQQTTDGDTTISMADCTPVVEAPPPLIPWWGFLLSAIVAIAFIVSTGMVRYRAHERKQADRAKELDAQIALAKARKTCTICGGTYQPEMKEKS